MWRVSDRASLKCVRNDSNCVDSKCRPWKYAYLVTSESGRRSTLGVISPDLEQKLLRCHERIDTVIV